MRAHATPGLRLLARRLGRLLVAAACALWTAWGLAIVLATVSRHDDLGTVPQLLFVIGCIATGAAFGHVRFAFGEGERRLEVSPDAAFTVLAAVLLAPPVAALVALLSSVTAVQREQGALRRTYVAANAAGSVGLASLLAHAVAGGTIDARSLLPAAVVAAATRAVTGALGTLAVAAARRAGGAAALVRSSPVGGILLLDTGLPALAVAIVAGYVGHPLASLLVVIAAQGFVWAVLRMLHTEYREREQNVYLRDAVSRYMPLPVARTLIDEEQHVAPTLGGTQREITVMFCDVRHFTSWAEQHDPDEVLAELNRLLTDLSQAVIATDGTLDKFTGDGFMAFWGAPNDQPDHARRAMQAVPQLLMRAREFNIRREAEGQPPLDIGIGVNSGMATVGNVGHRDRLNYTAIGDTINLAARLESATRDLDCPVLLSEATFLALPLAMQSQCARLDSIEVKGRRDRVRLYTTTQLARYRGTWWRPTG